MRTSVESNDYLGFFIIACNTTSARPSVICMQLCGLVKLMPTKIDGSIFQLISSHSGAANAKA